jgi:hypothetical protein
VIDPAMTPAALLRGAGLYLQRHGWIQGEIFGDGGTTDAFPPACAIGAVNVSAHGQPILSSADGSDDDLTDAAIRAMRVFAASLDPEYSACSAEHPHICDRSAIDIIGDWNDEDGRTLDEVVEALTEAADDWDRIHATGGAR